jgi:hypothetical protein
VFFTFLSNPNKRKGVLFPVYNQSFLPYIYVFLGPSGIRLSIPETILIPPCCNREYGKTRGIKENVRRTEKKKKESWKRLPCQYLMKSP